MNSNLNQKIKELGDGDIINIKSREYIFKLSRYKKNPIVRPQDIGLTWCENKKKKIGAVFNPGAEIYKGRVCILTKNWASKDIALKITSLRFGHW
jgi:predicted GH43/DUF377 family glycosyl hydrolase